jgi:hypothetical protein
VTGNPKHATTGLYVTRDDDWVPEATLSLGVFPAPPTLFTSNYTTILPGLSSRCSDSNTSTQQVFPVPYLRSMREEFCS